VLRLDPAEDAGLGIRACIALCNRRTQLREPSFLAELLMLKSFLACAENVLDGRKPPSGNLSLGETRKVFRQIRKGHVLRHERFLE
jgi:hypothetical protein